MSGAPQVKAQGFTSFVEAARHELGAATFASVVQALPARTRELVDRPPMPVAWIDAAHWFALTKALVEVGLGGDASRLRPIARRQMAHDLGGVYRVFIRFASPEFIIRRAANVYSAYWRNHGTLRAEPRGPNECDALFEDLPGVDAAFWEAQIGAVQSALEASGTKNVRVELLSSSPTHGHLRATWR